MLRIHCPFCGPRDFAEFDYAGAAGVAYPELKLAPGALDETPAKAAEREAEWRDGWVDAVYRRDDPKGPHREVWRHTRGCGLWLEVERDTLTHEIASVRAAHPGQAAALEADA